MPQQIHYRMTVYDGTLFSDTTTVLTPAASAPHTDPFKVTTLPNLSGWKPYMRVPKGERGAFDLKTAGSTVGTYTVELLDKRTADGNINRFISAFIGNTNAMLSIVGRKVYIEESLDNGSSWSPFFVGRINDVNMSNPLVVSFKIGDSVELLKQKLFTSRPRTDYVVFKSLLPLGLIKDLTTVSGSETSKIPAVAGLRIESIPTGTDSRIIKLSSEALNDTANFWPFDPEVKSSDINIPTRGTNGSYSVPPLRCMVQVGSSFYHYAVDYMTRPYNWVNTKEAYTPIEKVRVLELPTTDSDYAPLTAIDGNLVAIKRLWIYRLISDDASKLNTFWLSANPYTIAKDVLEGKFFVSTSLSIGVAYDSSSLTSLQSSQPLPDAIFRINETVEAAKFIEDYICKPYNLGYTIEPIDNSGVPKSRLRFFSTRQPQSGSLGGLVTINGTDVVAESAKEWSSNPPIGGVDFTFYMESSAGLSRSTKNLTISPDIESVVETSYTTIFLPSAVDSVDASYKRDTINMNGVRGILKNPLNPNNVGAVNQTSAYNVSRANANRLATEYYNRRKSGIPTVRLSTVRNSKTNGILVGDFVFVEVEVLPNQATHTRGGTRVMQVLQKTPNGLMNDFELIDSGINAVMATPSLGSVTSPDISQVSFSITTTEKATVEIEAAIVPAGGSAPAASSVNWMLVERLPVNTTTVTHTINALPEGRRIYVRIRATSPDNALFKLASPWVTSSGLDLSNLGTPSTVTVTNTTTRSAKVNWTNTESEYPIEVWLASPAGTPDTQISSLPAGSTSYTLRGLDKNSSTSHRVGIRYVDGVLGYGPFGTADFTATGAAPVLDAPAAILIYNK